MTPRTLIVATVLVGSLAGCSTMGQSRLNPFNWFRSGDSTETLAAVDVDTDERRPLVAEIIQLVVEHTPGGAIVRVTGLPPEQGWFAPELVRESPDGIPINGVLFYSLRAVPPLTPTRVSTRQSRELSAAVVLNHFQLSQVRSIRVTGALNSRTARR